MLSRRPPSTHWTCSGVRHCTALYCTLCTVHRTVQWSRLAVTGGVSAAAPTLPGPLTTDVHSGAGLCQLRCGDTGTTEHWAATGHRSFHFTPRTHWFLCPVDQRPVAASWDSGHDCHRYPRYLLYCWNLRYQLNTIRTSISNERTLYQLCEY